MLGMKNLFTDDTAIFTKWFICLSAALYPFSAFFQMNCLNVIGSPIQKAFHLNHLHLTHLSTNYLYADALFLIPAGILIDIISPSLIIPFGMFLMALGTIFLATSSHVETLFIIRFFMGAAHAFALIACFRLSHLLLPSNKSAFAIGLITTIALSGGLFAQTPLVLFVNVIGWKNALLSIGILGISFSIYLKIILPSNINIAPTKKNYNTFFASFMASIKNLQTWICGVYTGLLSLPLMLLGALWGSTFLINVGHVSSFNASLLTSLLFIGFMIGSPIIGAISDKINTRKKPMILASGLLIILLLPLISNQQFSFSFLTLLFFTIGFVSSTQVLAYSLIIENNPPSNVGTALGIASVLIMLIGAIGQRCFVYLLDNTSTKTLFAFHLNQFTIPMLLMPLAFAVAFVLAFFLISSDTERYSI